MVLEPGGKKNFLKFDHHCGNGNVWEEGALFWCELPISLRDGFRLVWYEDVGWMEASMGIVSRRADLVPPLNLHPSSTHPILSPPHLAAERGHPAV